MKIYRAIVFSAGPEGIYVRVPNLYDTIYGPLECISSDPLISPIYKKGDSVVIQQVSNDADDYMVVGYRTIGSEGSQLPVEWDGILNKPFTFNPSAHTHLWSEIAGKPSTFPPALHSHTWTEILSKPTTFPPATHSHAWADITSKPTTFPPATHGHAWGEITGKPTTFAPTSHTHGWGEVTGKPTTFTPTSHTHDWGEVTGKPSFLQIGTTATTAAAGNHIHTWNAISGKPTVFPPSTHAHAWADITSKPATFTPSAHTHEGDNLTPNSVVSTRAVNVGGSGQNEIMMYPTGMNQTINGISVPVMADKGFVPAIHNHNGDTLRPLNVLIESGQSTNYFKLEVSKDGISQNAYGIASPVLNPNGLGFVPASHNHALATSSLDGFMAKADKALLDTATFSPTPNSMMRRHSSGSVQVETGSSAKDAANKAYVDGYKILWGIGGTYMNGDQSVSLSETVSSQKTGIVLCWSNYASGAAENNSWNYQFVPKWHVSIAPGTGVYTILHRSGGTTIQKYVYIGNTAISGNASNTTAPNNTVVLRAVLGV